MPKGKLSQELFSFRPVGKILTPMCIESEFRLMHSSLATNPPSAGDFAQVGRGSGTHLLKLVSSRSEVGENVLRVTAPGANQRPPLFPSVNAALSPVCKIVFRPLEVKEHPTRHLVDHILNPDELSPVVTSAFAAVFGTDALNALSEALNAPLRVQVLPAREFPIIFLPRPGGGDLQATPVAPAEAYDRMREVTEPFFQKGIAGQPAPPRGTWLRQKVSDKPQNISAKIGGQRTRFLARMPRVLERREAEIRRYVAGGGFPPWRDEAVADSVMAYADLLNRRDEYSNENIRSGLDRRADALIEGAWSHIEEVRADAEAGDPDRTLPPAPSPADVILRGRWGINDESTRARQALTSDHFRDREQQWEASRAVRRP